MCMGVRKREDNMSIDDVPVFDTGREFRYYHRLRDCRRGIALIFSLLNSSNRC